MSRTNFVYEQGTKVNSNRSTNLTDMAVPTYVPELVDKDYAEAYQNVLDKVAEVEERSAKRVAEIFAADPFEQAKSRKRRRGIGSNKSRGSTSFSYAPTISNFDSTLRTLSSASTHDGYQASNQTISASDWNNTTNRSQPSKSKISPLKAINRTDVNFEISFNDHDDSTFHSPIQPRSSTPIMRRTRQDRPAQLDDYDFLWYLKLCLVYAIFIIGVLECFDMPTRVKIWDLIERICYWFNRN